MLAVMAVLTAADRAARLLCERSRASVAAEFFAGAPKSLRKGIAVYIAVLRPPLLLLLPLQAATTRVDCAQRASRQRRRRIGGFGGLGVVQVGLGMAEVSLGLFGGGGDPLCTRQSSCIGGCAGDK
jgi:hypothetical protein